MTMYLSNPELRATGSEPAEFIDAPAPIDRPMAAAMRLDVQTRLNITRWAEEYIAGLVENHNGGPDDVRSIIHQLHDRRTVTGRVGSL